MSSLALELDRLLQQVDPETAARLEQSVRDALAVAERRISTAAATDLYGYPAGYFEATAGSFANEPLERPVEMPMQQREPW